MSIRIDRATLENASEIGELFNAYRVFYKQDSNLELALNFIFERIKNDESVIFYAINESEEILGFTQLYPVFSSVSARSSWILNDLFVSSSARRKGIAKKLMERAREFANETNAKGLELATGIDNLNAQALYESLGYKKEKGFYHYYLDC